MNTAERVVVIGTGPAGAAASVFLSRGGAEPFVLEAGSGSAALGLTARVRGLTVAKFKAALNRREAEAPGEDEVGHQPDAISASPTI